MTDKVQKIREEVERLRHLHQMEYQQLDENDNMCLVECGKRNLCDNLLEFIDSMQEEPVSSVVDDSDISCDAELCAIHTGCKYFNPNKKCNVNHCIGGLPLQLRQKKEEPVSEDLLKELKGIVNIRECVTQGVPVIKIARHFANLQKEQMMKDAIEACFTLFDGFCIDRELYKNYKVGGKYKLIVIKED